MFHSSALATEVIRCWTEEGVIRRCVAGRTGNFDETRGLVFA